MTTPTITNFVIPNLLNNMISYQIIQPTSNSSGTFSYSVTTSTGGNITLTGNTINIATTSVGSYTITATQGASGSFASGTATASFKIFNSEWRSYRDAAPGPNEFLYRDIKDIYDPNIHNVYLGLSNWKTILYVGSTYVALALHPNPNNDELVFGDNSLTNDNYKKDPTIAKQVMTSTDGIIWSGRNTIPLYLEDNLTDVWSWQDMAYNPNNGANGRILTVSNTNPTTTRGQNMMYSDDYGSTWIQMPTNNFGTSNNCIIYQSNINRFITLRRTDCIMYVSMNGEGNSWKDNRINTNVNNYLNIGSPSVLTSINSVVWNSICYSSDYDCYVAVASPSTNNTLRLVLRFLHSELIATDINTTTTSFNTSNTGVWQPNNFKDAPKKSDGFNYSWNSVIYGKTVFGAQLFISVGNNAIMKSTDGGNTWTLINTTNQTFITQYKWNKVIFSENMFIVTGSSGQCIVSSDGDNWYQTTTYNTLNWSSVVYGNNQFVAVSSDVVSDNTVMIGLDLTSQLITPVLSNFSVPNLTSNFLGQTTYTINPSPSSTNTDINATFSYSIVTNSGTTISTSSNRIIIPAGAEGSYTITATQNPYGSYRSEQISTSFTISKPQVNVTLLHAPCHIISSFSFV
jgi:hypothetical protein